MGVTLLQGVRDILRQGREDGGVVEEGDAVAPATVGRLEALVDEYEQLRVGDAGFPIGEFRVGDEVAVDVDWDFCAHVISLPFWGPAGEPGRQACLAYDALILGAAPIAWGPATGPVSSPQS